MPRRTGQHDRLVMLAFELGGDGAQQHVVFADIYTGQTLSEFRNVGAVAADCGTGETN